MKHIKLDCYITTDEIQLVDHKHRVNVWNLLKRDYVDEDNGDYQPYFMLTYFPTNEDQVRVFTEYDKQGLINYDDAIINQTHKNNEDQVNGRFNIGVQFMDIKSLPDMNWYIEEGRVYCESNGITRSFEMVTVKNKKTKSVIYRYFTLLRNDPVNVIRVVKDIDDNYALRRIVEAQNDPEVGIEIEVDSVYVLIDNKYNND